MADKKGRWLYKYGIGEEYQFGTYAPSTAGLPITNFPEFDSGLDVIDTRIATSNPYRSSIEFIQGNKSPGVTLEQNAKADDLVYYLLSLFQCGWESDTDPYTKTFIPKKHKNSFIGQQSYIVTGNAGVTIASSTTFTPGLSVPVQQSGVRVGDWVYISGTLGSGDEGLYRRIVSFEDPWTLTLSGSNFSGDSGLTWYIYRNNPFFFSLAKSTGVNSQGMGLISSIVNSLILSGDSGAPMTLSGEIFSEDIVTNVATQTNHTFTLSTDTPLLFKDLHVLIAIEDQDSPDDPATNVTTATAQNSLTFGSSVNTTEFQVGHYVTFQPFRMTGSNRSLYWTEIKTTYTIDDNNRYIDVDEDSGGEVSVTLTKGDYNPVELANHITKILNDSGSLSGVYTCSYNGRTKKFTISVSGPSTMSLLWKTGTHGADGTGTNFGTLKGVGNADIYNQAADDTGSLSYEADVALVGGDDVAGFTTFDIGYYTGIQMAMEIEDKMNNNNSGANLKYAVSYLIKDHKFRITVRDDTGRYPIAIDTSSSTCEDLLGFRTTDPTGYVLTSDTAVGANTGGAYRITEVDDTSVTVAGMEGDPDSEVIKVTCWKLIPVDSISLTMNHNYNRKFYNCETVQEYIPGDFTIEGNISIPWGFWSVDENLLLNRFLAGRKLPFIFAWGSTGSCNAPDKIERDAISDGSIAIEFYARYTGTPSKEDSGGELVDTLPFASVEQTKNYDIIPPHINMSNGTQLYWHYNR